MAPRSKIRTSRCSWRGLSLLGRPGENRTLRASAPRRRHAFRQRITELAAHLIRRATSFRDNFSPRSFSARLRRSESSSAEPLGRIETSFRQEVYYIALFCVRPIVLCSPILHFTFPIGSGCVVHVPWGSERYPPRPAAIFLPTARITHGMNRSRNTRALP